MKIFATLAFSSLAFLPVAAFADRIDWQDLSPEDEVRLEQPLPLVTLKGMPFEIPAGTLLAVKDVIPLEVSVVDVVFSFATCPLDSSETEMSLILPEGGRENSEVGVQVSAACELEVFIETKDYSSLSFMGTR